MANTFSNTATANLPTTLTQIQVAPSGVGATSTIIGCSFANTSAAPITVDLAITTGGATPANPVYLVRQATVPVGGALVAIGAEQKVVLGLGQSLSGRSSTLNACDVAISVLTVTP